VGRIAAHEFMSIDGVIDAPTWTFDYGFDARMGDAIGAVLERCHAILLGRTTFEMFEQSWPQRTVEDEPGAPFFNDTTKCIVSSSFADPAWRNSRVIGPYDADALRRLKTEVDGDIYTSGSATLVRAMLGDQLVDELHLFVFPLTRAAEPHLFTEKGQPRSFELEASDTYDDGVVYLSYRQATSQ
jgi:dihydrofolate reductase